MKATILRIIGLAGVLVFGALFWFTFSRPQWVEDAAASFIRTEVQKKIDAHLEGITLPSNGRLGELTGRLYEQMQAKMAEKRDAVKANIHQLFDVAIERIRNADAGEREKLEWARLARGVELKLIDFTTSGLDNFIQTTYLDVVAKLKRDIRIFAGSNMAAFLLLLIGSFSRRDSVDVLFVPGLLLGASVAFCTWCYVFNQNWLWTIVYGSYVGYGYLLGIWLIFLLLLDIVLNRARVTLRIIGGSLLPGIPVFREK